MTDRELLDYYDKYKDHKASDSVHFITLGDLVKMCSLVYDRDRDNELRKLD